MPEETPDNVPSDFSDPDADCFHPPSIPTLVGCLHCGEEYESYRIEWRVEPDVKGQPFGSWCCPIEGCDGRGFGFDILPVDPDYVDPDGREMGWCDDPPPDPETDPDRPPSVPTEVRCKACDEVYRSDAMTWYIDEEAMEDPDAWVDAGWCCPTPGCDGRGFGWDIRPTDPQYEDPDGRRILRWGESWELPPRPEGGSNVSDITEDDIPF